MNISEYDTPAQWFHVTDVFTPLEMAVIEKHIPKQGLEISGRRAHNTTARSFVTVNSPDELINVFEKYDGWQLRKVFSEITGVDCHTGRLRIELVNDQAGAHLERHVDIKEKLITFQVYMNDGDPSWGTTIYKDWDNEHATVPFIKNTAWLTHRDVNIIHGVKQNSVTGERHSVIINYIEGEWRDTDQLFHLK